MGTEGGSVCPLTVVAQIRQRQEQQRGEDRHTSCRLVMAQHRQKFEFPVAGRRMGAHLRQSKVSAAADNEAALRANYRKAAAAAGLLVSWLDRLFSAILPLLSSSWSGDTASGQSEKPLTIPQSRNAWLSVANTGTFQLRSVAVKRQLAIQTDNWCN